MKHRVEDETGYIFETENEHTLWSHTWVDLICAYSIIAIATDEDRVTRYSAAGGSKQITTSSGTFCDVTGWRTVVTEQNYLRCL